MPAAGFVAALSYKIIYIHTYDYDAAAAPTAVKNYAPVKIPPRRPAASH
jgi:hypothetical protein